MSKTEFKIDNDLGKKKNIVEESIVPEDILNTVENKAKDYLNHARGSHDWDHTVRVFQLCRRIGSVEGADMTVLAIAAYLHDIGRAHQDMSDGDICHAEKGAEIAEIIVDKLPLTRAQKKNIVHCVRTHRFRSGQTPETLEAMVLFDADKLDAIGAIGVARAYLFAGEVGARLHNPKKKIEETQPYSKDDTGYREYKVKLSKIKNRMLTQEGGRLADQRHAFMETFFNRFLMEYEGKG